MHHCYKFGENSDRMTYHFLCFNAIELMSTIATSVDVAKCTRVADVTCNERYSLHNVSMHHLLYRNMDQHFVNYHGASL